jgi:hypothetical protein
VSGEDRPVEALELSGHRASLRIADPVEPQASVRLTLCWKDGGETLLPARVRSVSRSFGAEGHLALVDFDAVEGDWRAFLEYLGPAALGAA